MEYRERKIVKLHMSRVNIHFQVAKICISTTKLLLTIARRDTLLSCKEAANEFAQKPRPLTPESQTWRVFQRKAH